MGTMVEEVLMVVCRLDLVQEMAGELVIEEVALGLLVVMDLKTMVGQSISKISFSSIASKKLD